PSCLYALSLHDALPILAPGLYPHEKRALLLTLPAIMILFVIGLSFAYFVMLPVAIAWLQGFMNTVIKQQWTIQYYVDFITRVCLDRKSTRLNSSHVSIS